MATKKRLTKQELLAKVVKKQPSLNLSFIDEQPYRALLALIAETGNRFDWRCVCFRMYVGLKLLVNFKEEHEIEMVINKSLLQLEDINNYFKASNKYLFRPNQAAYVNKALMYISEMQKLTTQEELIEAYRSVENRFGATPLDKQ